MKMVKSQAGYIALITAIIVGAVVLIMAIATTLVGIGQSRNGFLSQNFAEARSLAAACAEKALIDLKDNHNYTGNETINLGNGQCQIAAIEDLGGEARIIKLTGVVNNVTRKTKIEISQIDPSMTLVSWQEVADF